jgi:hypothetical protein
MKWNYWLSTNFPTNYEKRRKFTYMSIEELADYFMKNQDEFKEWQDFIEERCDAEEPCGYFRFCHLVKMKREIAKTVTKKKK